MKKNLGFAIASLVLVVPLMFANVVFLMEIWNKAIAVIFNSLPILSYKSAFALYFIKSMFGFDFKYSPSYYINKMINEGKSEVEITFYTMIATSLSYLLTWFIIFKIIL
jgi:hypothetical protein